MDIGRKKTFAWLTALLYVIAALHIAALYFFWYWSIWWYDILMHMLGGVWIGGMALFIFLGKWQKVEMSILARFGAPFFVVLLIGILWEAFEWNVDQIILSKFQNDLSDTLSDIGAAIAGGLFSSFLWNGYVMRARSHDNYTHD